MLIVVDIVEGDCHRRGFNVVAQPCYFLHISALASPAQLLTRSTSTMLLTPPPNLSLMHTNLCLTLRLPPRQIEIGDTPVGVSHPCYTSAVKAQTVNMNASDENEYKVIMIGSAFKIEESGVDVSSNHRTTRALKAKPSWANYIFGHSIQKQDTLALNMHAAGFFDTRIKYSIAGESSDSNGGLKS